MEQKARPPTSPFSLKTCSAPASPPSSNKPSSNLSTLQPLPCATDYDNSVWAPLVILARMFPEVPAYRARLDAFANEWTRGGAGSGSGDGAAITAAASSGRNQHRRRDAAVLAALVNGTSAGAEASSSGGGNAAVGRDNDDDGDLERSLPQAANAAFLLLTYANGLKEGKAARKSLECFARAQIDHILGRARGGAGGGGGSSSGRSFVVGFGRNPPLQPAHCGASCAAPLGERCDARSAFELRTANPHTLVGALVAGPDANGAFADDRTNLAQSRVAVDHNAALTGALAALVQARGLGKHCPY